MSIIHRDIKPENVLILNDVDPHTGLPVAKLLDFGLSKNAGHSIAKTFVGTPCYLAPEVEYTSKGLGGRYGTPADCWSLGALLYVMLVARFPEFEANPAVGGMTLKMPPSLWSHISNSAKSLILGLMTVDPNQRLTVRDVMQHPWLGDYRVSASELDLVALAERKHQQSSEGDEDAVRETEVPMVLDEKVEEPQCGGRGSAPDPVGGGSQTRDTIGGSPGTYYQTQTAWIAQPSHPHHVQQQQQQQQQHAQIAWLNNSGQGGGNGGSGGGPSREAEGGLGAYRAVVLRGSRQVAPSSADPPLPFAPLLNLQRQVDSRQ